MPESLKPMSIPQKYFLLGMMGSGKSTLGRSLAAEIGIPFIDLDEAVVSYIGQTIPEVFESRGEDEFRRIESLILQQFCLSQDSFVMATGGGTPCFGDNLETMKHAGKTVFLDVPVQTLVTRLATNKSGRPLISGLGTLELASYLEKLRDTRLVWYTGAAFTLRGENIGISAFPEAGIL